MSSKNGTVVIAKENGNGTEFYTGGFNGGGWTPNADEAFRYLNVGNAKQAIDRAKEKGYLNADPAQCVVIPAGGKPTIVHPKPTAKRGKDTLKQRLEAVADALDRHMRSDATYRQETDKELDILRRRILGVEAWVQDHGTVANAETDPVVTLPLRQFIDYVKGAK